MKKVLIIAFAFLLVFALNVTAFAQGYTARANRITSYNVCYTKLLRTAENTMIPSGLRKFGASSKEALSKFGQIGMVMPIIFFPCGILAAVGTLLIPEVSEAYAVSNMRRVQYIFANVFQNTILLAIMFCGVFMAFATDFGLLIYQSGDVARLLMALAPLVPLIYLDFIVDSMLNGLNQQFQTLKINILDSALRIVP